MDSPASGSLSVLAGAGVPHVLESHGGGGGGEVGRGLAVDAKARAEKEKEREGCLLVGGNGMPKTMPNLLWLDFCDKCCALGMKKYSVLMWQILWYDNVLLF